MMNKINFAAFHNSLMAFYFFFFLVESVSSRHCTPSCGNLHTITYPFRMAGDPLNCGDIELNCEGNITSIYIYGAKYFVADISYDELSVKFVFAAGLSNNSACGVQKDPGHDQKQDGDNSDQIYPTEYQWVDVMCCSQKIDNRLIDEGYYMHLPSLSNNLTTAYANITMEFGGRISDLRTSCSFLRSFPVDLDSQIRSEKDVLQAARAGNDFLGYWNIRPGLRSCLRDSLGNYISRRNGHVRIIHTAISISASPFVIDADIMNCLRLSYCKSGSSNIICDAGFQDLLAALSSIKNILLALAILKKCIGAPLSVYVFIVHKFRKTKTQVDLIEKFLRIQQTIMPTRYAYSDLIAMTNNFKEKLGQGGFGSVFKGHLHGVLPVAVKMLVSTKLNGEEFISEVSTIGRIHHVNIVRLLGFCSEGSRRALIYEYMPNGSLDKYIFSSKLASRDNINPLTFEMLNEIALGVARGIDYLHRGCEMQILHFDIKPHNILLDSNFIPKVSDFGLAKLYPKDHSLVSASVARGTIGYIAPEWISRSFGAISYKSDVYSFGMLLMEMAGQRRNVDHGVSRSSQVYYPSWIYDKLLEKQEDNTFSDITFDIDDMEAKLCKIGLWCIQMKPSNRPSMSEVVALLEGNNVDEIKMPPKPFFTSSEPNIVTHPSNISLAQSIELSIISEDDEIPLVV